MESESRKTNQKGGWGMNRLAERISKTIIAVIVCWLLLPIILVAVTLICALIPFIAFIKPEIVKINEKN
jgi:hypothetical protein